MQEEKEKHELSIIESWESIKNIIKDGKITFKELPELLRNYLSMFKFISKFLVFFKTDPKIAFAINSINIVIENLVNNIDENKDNIAIIWEQINKILEDDKVSEEEIKGLLICISELFSILSTIGNTFINNKVIYDFDKLKNKILNYVEIIKISK